MAEAEVEAARIGNRELRLLGVLQGQAGHRVGDIQQQLAHRDLAVARPVVGRAFDALEQGIGQRAVTQRAELDRRLLAIRRGGRYVYRPRGRITLVAGDEVLANGPRDGRVALAEQAGYDLPNDGEAEPY